MTDDLVQRGDLVRLVAYVYDAMLGCSAVPADGANLSEDSRFTAAVHYVGAWKGALVVECSAAQAGRWAERLMPIDPPATEEDARDGLGELTNVIAGNLKPLLPGGVSLSMPSVIDGPGHKLRLPVPCRSESYTFEDDTGPFRIVLIAGDSIGDIA